ncbi:hypothetical protein HR12_28730, partial [Microbacterium sp. SUBG005]
MTNTSGWANPAAARRAVAMGTDPEVTMARRSAGTEAKKSAAPRMGARPTASATSRSVTCVSASACRSTGRSRLTSVRAGWPWLACRASIDTSKCSAKRRQERATDAVESTRVPSRSNSTASNSRDKIAAAASRGRRMPSAGSTRASCCPVESSASTEITGDGGLDGGGVGSVRVAGGAARGAAGCQDRGVAVDVDDDRVDGEERVAERLPVVA